MSDSTLVATIKDARARGVSEEEMYSKLLASGTSVSAIQSAIDEISSAADASKNQQRATRVIATFGAVFIAVGIFSFFVAQWNDLTNPMRVVILLASMVTSYVAGWLVKTDYGLEKTGTALMLLGVLIYGASIFLIASMYHVRLNVSDGFVLWMLGAVALATHLRSPAIHVLAILVGLLGAASFVVEAAEFPSGSHSITGLGFTTLLLCAGAVLSFWQASDFRRRMPVSDDPLF